MNLRWLAFILQLNLISPWPDGPGLHSGATLKAATEAGHSAVLANSGGHPGQPPVPVAHVSRNFYLPRPNSPVYLARLSAGFSTDADGEIIEFSWRVDGSSYRGAEIEIVSFQQPAAATRVQVELTVRDNDGQASTLTTELVITNISAVSSQSPP